MHTFYDDPKAKEEFEDPDFDENNVAAELAGFRPGQTMPDDFEPLT